MEILPQILMNTIIAGAIYSMIALGFNIIFRVTKFFNISHGVFIVLGGYFLLLLNRTFGVNLYLSIGMSIILVAFSGALIDKLVFLPLRKKGASSIIMLVASLGILTAVQAAIAIVFGTDFQRLSGKGVISETYEVFGAVITGIQSVILITGMFIMTGLVMLINKTRFGKAVKAIGDDEEVAGIVGINTDRIIGITFFIGSAIAGLGGILIGYDVGLMPTMGMLLLLKAVTASIIGGTGNIYGGILGAYLLGFAENTGVYFLSGAWKDAIAFGILIFFLLFRPQGVLNK